MKPKGDSDVIQKISNMTQPTEKRSPSAKKGYKEAQYNLGLMYYSGDGVQQDYKQAAHWYTEATYQGYAEAQYNLSNMYYYGKGVPQDDKKSYMWFNLAVHNGFSSSQEFRDRVAKGLNSQDLIEAQEMAKRCLDSGYKDC